MDTHTLAVSFYIEWGDTSQENATYSRIYEALNEAITDGLYSDDFWAETTSFYVLKSDQTATQFLARVWTAAKMRPSKDKLLVIDVDIGSAAVFGHIEDQSLFSVLPLARRVGTK